MEKQQRTKRTFTQTVVTVGSYGAVAGAMAHVFTQTLLFDQYSWPRAVGLVVAGAALGTLVGWQRAVRAARR